MKIKIVAGLSIFILLFSSAWSLHLQQQNHRKSNDYKMESQINNLNVVPINNENTQFNTNFNVEKSTDQWNFSMPFKPREYVRIIGF
ncbi:hypothetical protein V7087_16550 [Neobacillus niacini]|uniref:hypothetical protein n=1 Tax=Neobacillus niacini TaxID=86668 RepID=UPI002FFEA788